MNEISSKTGDMDNRQRLLMEAYKRTLLRLDSQQTIALASDQRALVAAGVSVAGATLIYSDKISSTFQLIAVGCMVAASILSLISAMPQSMYTSGSHFKDLSRGIEAGESFDDAVLQLGELNDVYIDRNENLACERSNKFRFFIGFFCMGALFFLLHVLETK